MDHFAALRALRAIVEAGSFTAAAERLGTTHSAMSRQLRQLEEHLQVRLLDRNSRRLSLTEAGRDYYREAVALLDRLEAADDRARAGQAEPSGRLRISVPQVVASQELPHWLPGFLARDPQVSLDLSSDDQLVVVVVGGFDLALRIAPSLPDSHLVARELAGRAQAITAGETPFRDYGLTSARGEAEQGFITVRRAVLPFWQQEQGERRLHNALLRLMAVNRDSNLVSRGGLAGLRYVQDYAQQLLATGWERDDLRQMDQALIARHLSPGGSADLLAVAYVLAMIP